MILYINSKDQNKVTVSLKKNNRYLKTLSKKNKFGSQALLPLIVELLTRSKLSFQDLNKIEVETGPGSFTGLRVGISLANALSFALGIPINKKTIEVNLRYT